jgi:ribosomal protein S18 acetylase RimI-like enzyme
MNLNNRGLNTASEMGTDFSRSVEYVDTNNLKSQDASFSHLVTTLSPYAPRLAYSLDIGLSDWHHAGTAGWPFLWLHLPMSASTANLAGVSLRRALPEDESFLFGVYAGTRAEELGLTDWTPAQKDIFLRMQFDAQRRSYAMQYPHAEYWVIQRDGADVGRMITDRSGEQIALMDIAVLPEFRNRKVASLLMADLLAEASRIAKSVLLHVERFNPALQWYQRLGFRVVVESEIYFEMLWEPARPHALPATIGTGNLDHGTDPRAV